MQRFYNVVNVLMAGQCCGQRTCGQRHNRSFILKLLSGGVGGGGIFVHVAKETKRGGNSLKVGTMLMANCLI